MKLTLLLLAIFLFGKVQAQTSYNNEWINYTKTYYKFSVIENKLHRISYTALQSANLHTIPAEQFQLYKNGQQVPIYTSVASGAFGTSDYIEFYATANDGNTDTQLYDEAINHLNKKWSLINDTAAYFLTVNTNSAENLRLQNTPNNVASNTLAVEQSFMHTVGSYPKNSISAGFAAVVGEELHASIYDKGEGWTSDDIYTNNSYTYNFTNLYPDLSSAKIPSYTFAGSGKALNLRTFLNKINNTTVLDQQLNYYEAGTFSTTFPLSLLGTGAANTTIQNTSSSGNDRMAIAYVEIKYPRQFNFGGASTFNFELEAKLGGNYLEITNFNNGSTVPVLYDCTNGKRYIAVVDGSTLKFALEGSTVNRKLVLVNQASANYTQINSLQTKTFTNFMSAANQGTYLILTSKALHTSTASTNAIEKYKQYRSSTAGGSFAVQIIDVEDLYDQYAYGVSKHPAALRNYLRQARNSFATTPKFVLLIGRGVAYNEARLNPDVYTEQLNLVPTFGYPASDNLLTANPGTSVQTTPIGRLGAINNAEVEDYLNKLKDYELKQADMNFTIANKAWMLNASFVAGSSEPFLQTIIDNYQTDYMNIWKDTSVGGTASLFTKTTAGGPVPLTNDYMVKMWNEGHSSLSYFGHSSATALEFNLDDPSIYNNQGKYPVMIINGCNAGNFFVYNPFRITTNNNATLSEKFVFAPNKGSIGFIASTSFGVVNYLHYYNINLHKESAGASYGKSIGELMRAASQDMFALTGPTDYYAKMHSQQILLQGDPALKFNASYPKPDYVIEPQTVKLNNDFISIANDSFAIDMYYMNLGKAIKKDSINITVKREFPNGTVKTMYTKRVVGTYYKDSLRFGFAIMPITDKGLNKIIIKVDDGNERDEMSETNNIVVKEVYINEFEAKPIHPYNYAIVNALPLKLTASTANPLATSRDYYMELDTTTFFNSTIKQQQTLTQTGGLLEFTPITSLLPNTTYYWRVASSGTTPLRWNTYSFTYLPSSTYGFNQGHLYQHLKSTMDGVKLDSATRKFSFDSIGQNITIRNAVWPWGNEESHYTIAVNQDPYIRGICALNSVTVNVFNPVTGQPWLNTGSQYGSVSNGCTGGAQYNFTYGIGSLAERNALNNFITTVVPDGYYITLRNFNFYADPVNASSNWIGDSTINGGSVSMYNTLRNAGFTNINSVNDKQAFIFVYRKNRPTFVPKQVVGINETERVNSNSVFVVPTTTATITSPVFGPAKAWEQFHWRGAAAEATVGDTATVTIIGIKANGEQDSITTIAQNVLDVNINTINAATYPYLKLKMVNKDVVNATPWQLDYWRLNYQPVPEGAVAPNIDFLLKDTFQSSEAINAVLAFKNISFAAFDSIKVKISVLDSNQNIINVYTLPKQRNIGNNDTIKISYNIPNTNLAGNYTVLFDVNPDNHQAEQTHFNNLLYKSIYVTPNTLPVTWLRVNAVLQNNQSVITWSTATEFNTLNYIVEHSIDGRNFMPIGTVAAAGNSSTQRNYQLTHSTPSIGVNYYRIKQIDNDGQYKYSVIVTVVRRQDNGAAVIGPNPASNYITIYQPKPTTVKTIELYDAAGKLIQNITINQQLSTYTIPLNSLKPGSYVIKINNTSSVETYRFIKD